MYKIFFDRIIKDFTDTDIKLLDDFIVYLKQFEKSESEKNQTLLVAVLIVVNLAKTKKHKEYYEKFRVQIFDLIKNELNVNGEDVKEFVVRALSAVVAITRSAVAKEEIDEDVKKVFKVFIQNSVSFSIFVFY